MIKILTADLETINITKLEKDAVLKLRQLLPDLDNSEVTALATMLAHSYSITLGRWVSISASRNFGQVLTTAVLQVQALSASTKLAIAIELLQFCQEDELAAGHESSNDDDGDGKYDGDVDVDSLPNPRFHRS